MGVKDCGDEIAFNVRTTRDVLEVIDALHTQVLDNIGEDSELLEILERAMNAIDDVDFLETALPSPAPPVETGKGTAESS